MIPLAYVGRRQPSRWRRFLTRIGWDYPTVYCGKCLRPCGRGLTIDIYAYCYGDVITCAPVRTR